MGRGTYLGGSSIDGRWSDYAEFPLYDRESLPKRRVRKRLTKKAKLGLVAPIKAPPLVSVERASLIASIMKDVGQALPKKRTRFNAALKRLMAAGIMLSNGEPNLSHPVFQEWLRRMDRKKGKSRQFSRPSV